MLEAVYTFAEDAMETKLKELPSYEFLRETLPEFGPRPWLEVISRWHRIPVARLMLSQHRLPIEMGRWTRTERNYRICEPCSSAGLACAKPCTCTHADSHSCIGTETHYMQHCCLTRTICPTYNARVQQACNTSDSPLPEVLRDKDSHTYRWWNVVGKNWAQCCRDVLHTAEKKWKHPDTYSDSEYMEEYY